MILNASYFVAHCQFKTHLSQTMLVGKQEIVLQLQIHLLMSASGSRRVGVGVRLASETAKIGRESLLG